MWGQEKKWVFNLVLKLFITFCHSSSFHCRIIDTCYSAIGRAIQNCINYDGSLPRSPTTSAPRVNAGDYTQPTPGWFIIEKLYSFIEPYIYVKPHVFTINVHVVRHTSDQPRTQASLTSGSRATIKRNSQVSFIIAKLDYCNVILAYISGTTLMSSQCLPVMDMMGSLQWRI